MKDIFIIIRHIKQLKWLPKYFFFRYRILDKLECKIYCFKSSNTHSGCVTLLYVVILENFPYFKSFISWIYHNQWIQQSCSCNLNITRLKFLLFICVPTIQTLYKLEFELQVVAAIIRWGGRVDVGHQLNITRRCNKKSNF